MQQAEQGHRFPWVEETKMGPNPPRSILVFLAQSNPNRRPMSAQEKARLEKQAAALPRRRVLPLVRK